MDNLDRSDSAQQWEAIPRELIDAGDAAALALYCAMASHIDRSTGCLVRFSLGYVGSVTGLPDWSLRNAKKTLRRQGWISLVDEQGEQQWKLKKISPKQVNL